MQKSPTYHSSAILYNELLAKAARDASEQVEHETVKQWCIGIAKQHDFHAERHQAALEKIQNAAGSTDNTGIVEAQVATLVPSTTSVEIPTLAPTQVEVDVDLSKEN